MKYAKKVDGSPNTLITALMFKTVSHMFKLTCGTVVKGKINIYFTFHNCDAEKKLDFKERLEYL